MEQITSPLNVLLSYQPGDILYIDANPLGKPFYTVYCAETLMTQDYFDWTIKEYGHYKREHPCLYISEDHKGIDFTDLTGYVSSFTDYIHFPYSPLPAMTLTIPAPAYQKKPRCFPAPVFLPVPVLPFQKDAWIPVHQPGWILMMQKWLAYHFELAPGFRSPPAVRIC